MRPTYTAGISVDAFARRLAAPLFSASALLVVAGVAGCAGGSFAGDDTGLAPLIGQWRGVLLTQGGDLPFHLEVGGAEPPAVVISAGVETPFASVTRQGAASYTLSFVEEAGSRIVARMSPNGEELSGYWRSAVGDTTPGSGRRLQMPFSAQKNDRRRFPRNDPGLDVATEDGIAAVPDVTGTWLFDMSRVIDDAMFVDAGVEVVLAQDGETVTARIRDRPAMEGIYRNGLLRFSAFDGVEAFMFHGRAQPDGSLKGNLWWIDRSAVAWTGRRR